MGRNPEGRCSYCDRRSGCDPCAACYSKATEPKTARGEVMPYIREVGTVGPSGVTLAARINGKLADLLDQSTRQRHALALAERALSCHVKADTPAYAIEVQALQAVREALR